MKRRKRINERIFYWSNGDKAVIEKSSCESERPLKNKRGKNQRGLD